MKYAKKIGVIFLSICLLVSTFAMKTNAASGSVSITSKSGKVGSTVSVTCTIKCSTGAIGTADVVLVYDQSGLQWVSGTAGTGIYNLSGGSGSVRANGVTSNGTSTSFSFTMKFKILKAGQHRISVSSASAYDINEVAFTPSGSSGTITGTTTTTGGGTTTKPQTGKDSNNKLSSLQVYPGTLEPAFNADNTAYSVNVTPDTTSITISATPQSSKATVTVTGGSDLKLGPNLAQVVVVAENGTSRAYNITIMCGEVEKISFNGVEHTINENFTDEQIPIGFTRTKVTYNEREYEALANEKSGLKLLNLQNEMGAEFYIYDEAKQEFFSFIQISIAEGKYIIVLPLSEDVKMFQNSRTVKQTALGKEFEAWELDKEFSVAYVMNQDGEKTFYRYDSIDGVFQRYVESESIEVDAKGDMWPALKDILSKKIYYLATIAALAVLCLVLLIVLICSKAKKKRPKETRIEKVQRRMEKKKAKKLAKEMKKTKGEVQER